jgi:hypothetical protein
MLIVLNLMVVIEQGKAAYRLTAVSRGKQEKGQTGKQE